MLYVYYIDTSLRLHFSKHAFPVFFILLTNIVNTNKTQHLNL